MPHETTTHAKVCRACFRDVYGVHTKIQTITWGVQCARCLRESKSMETLVKISREELDNNPLMTPFGPIVTGPPKRADFANHRGQIACGTCGHAHCRCA
jgi:hypothetical protein